MAGSWMTLRAAGEMRAKSSTESTVSISRCTDFGIVPTYANRRTTRVDEFDGVDSGEDAAPAGSAPPTTIVPIASVHPSTRTMLRTLRTRTLNLLLLCG